MHLPKICHYRYYAYPNIIRIGNVSEDVCNKTAYTGIEISKLSYSIGKKRECQSSVLVIPKRLWGHLTVDGQMTTTSFDILYVVVTYVTHVPYKVTKQYKILQLSFGYLRVTKKVHVNTKCSGFNYSCSSSHYFTKFDL